MIRQLHVIEEYCEHVYAENALLEQQISNGGGGSTLQQDLEIRRLQGAIATNDDIIARQRAQIVGMTGNSTDAVKKAMAENINLNATVAQINVEIQHLKAKETHTVTEFNKMKTAYEAHVADMTKQYDALVQQKDTDDNAWNNLVDVNKDLQAQLAALPGQSAALQGGAPPADGNSIPAVYAPTIYPQVHQADALPQAAVVKQESGVGGFMSRFGWRGGGTAPAAPAGGALPGDAAAPPQPVQADPAAHGRRAGGAGGAAAGGGVAALASQFNAIPFVDPIQMSPSGMKAHFNANMQFDTATAKNGPAMLKTILNSAQYKPLVNQLAQEYNIDGILSEQDKIDRLIDVYKLTIYIYNLKGDNLKTFKAANNIILALPKNSYEQTASALKSKTRPDVLTILKLPEVVAALQAMN